MSAHAMKDVEDTLVGIVKGIIRMVPRDLLDLDGMMAIDVVRMVMAGIVALSPGTTC
jgi:hypothetical protein